MTVEAPKDGISELEQIKATVDALRNEISELKQFKSDFEAKVIALLESSDKINVGKTTPLTSAYADATKLQVGEGFLVVDGQEDPTIEGENKHVQAYLGGDSAGSEVHLGSLNPKVNTIVLFNPHTGTMNLRVGSIDAANIGGVKEAIDALKSQINDLRAQIASLDPRITNAQASADTAQGTANAAVDSTRFLVEKRGFLVSFLGLATYEEPNGPNGYKVFHFPNLSAFDIHAEGQFTTKNHLHEQSDHAWP